MDVDRGAVGLDAAGSRRQRMAREGQTVLGWRRFLARRSLKCNRLDLLLLLQDQLMMGNLWRWRMKWDLLMFY